MKLIKIDRFRSICFEEGSAPDRRTVRSWIDGGIVPGMVINGHAYVDLEKWEALSLTQGQQEIGDLILKVIG